MARLAWEPILDTAAGIVTSYDTGVTLRQLFYRLVSAELIPNRQSAYSNLSKLTAQARRDGWFPDLLDRGRVIHRHASWTSPETAMKALVSQYRRDRTEGQEFSIFLGVEKAGLVEQLDAWFSDLGLPILAVGGYSSQSYVDQVAHDVERQGRPAVLLYAGDFDPSGEDIDRDFVARTACWDKVVRVALTAEQVVSHNLPPQVGKSTDSRAGAFVERHGQLVQVELDALFGVSPDALRRLYQEALDEFWDTSQYDLVLDREQEERLDLTARLGE